MSGTFGLGDLTCRDLRLFGLCVIGDFCLDGDAGRRQGIVSYAEIAERMDKISGVAAQPEAPVTVDGETLPGWRGYDMGCADQEKGEKSKESFSLHVRYEWCEVLGVG